MTSKLNHYCTAALHGFFRSIALSGSHSLQDTLRLLTLWFDQGQVTEAHDALVDGLKTVQIDNWLQVRGGGGEGVMGGGRYRVTADRLV